MKPNMGDRYTQPTDITIILCPHSSKKLALDWHTYKVILKGFYDHHKDFPEKLMNAYAANDYDRLGAYAHSIKGSAANIRATIIARHAEALMIACRSETINTEQIKKAMDLLIRAIIRVTLSLEMVISD